MRLCLARGSNLALGSNISPKNSRLTYDLLQLTFLSSHRSKVHSLIPPSQAIGLVSRLMFILSLLLWVQAILPFHTTPLVNVLMGSIPDPTCTFYKTSSHTQGPKRFPSDASRTHPDASPSQRRRSEPLLTAAAATLSLTSGRAPISRVERGHVHETSDDVLGPCHEFWDPASCSYNIPADQLKRLLVQASKECCAQQLGKILARQ